MNIILRDINLDKNGYILAVRAGVSIAKKALKEGSVDFVDFENGAAFVVKVNKCSVTVYGPL